MALDLHVVLFEPEIPQNAGNIARTCACTGATLHLVEPMGFRYTQRNLARAGLDYWDKVTIVRHSCVDQFFEEHKGKRMLFFTGNTSRSFYHEDLAESRGIDPEVLDAHAEECVRLPMRESLRSLNLSNAVAIGVYETLRQNAFEALL